MPVKRGTTCRRGHGVVRLRSTAEDVGCRRGMPLSIVGREGHPRAGGCGLHWAWGTTTLASPVLVLWLVGGLGFVGAGVRGVTAAAQAGACRSRRAGVGDEGGVGGVGGRVRLLHLLHEKHA
jgi:hypothetical protein